MTYVVDPRVDAYIDALPEWQQAICRGPRPRPRRRPRGDRDDQADPPAVLRARGQHLRAPRGQGPRNVFLYDGAIVPDPEGIITAGHDNQTARTVGVREGEPINAHALRRYSSRSSPTTAPAAGGSSSSRLSAWAALSSWP